MFAGNKESRTIKDCMTKKADASLWISVFTLTFALSLTAAENKSIPSETTIWFDAPAKNFTESSPLGNGRLGAMMFGGVDDERIVLNESSVWSGSRQDADRPDAYKVLPEIRKLLLEGKNPEAEALVNANFTCKGPGSRRRRNMAAIKCSAICICHFSRRHECAGHKLSARIESQRRRGEHAVQSRRRCSSSAKCLSSAPDQVMVLRLSADKSKQISFDARLGPAGTI